MDSITSESFGFNPASPTKMHVDLNSCFATIEQQANPFLRGKPVAVAAYTSGNGCILAASYEAKRFGVSTGTRVRDGKKLCPDLIVMPGDPNKYRFVNRKLLQLFHSFTDQVEMRSIDEAVMCFSKTPVLEKQVSSLPAGQASIKYSFGDTKDKQVLRDFIHNTKYINHNTEISNVLVTQAMMKIGKQIKQKIKTDIGEWLTVSIGISVNRFLAKTAAGLNKPDGLDIITGNNIEEVLGSMKLEDLCGIKRGYGGRLRMCGITTALGFYKASMRALRTAFRSVVGYHWWLRLHGWEADDRQLRRKSIGHSHALYTPYEPGDNRLNQILCQLVEKMGRRLRSHRLKAGGLHVGCLFSDYSYWHQGRKLEFPLFASLDFYKKALKILTKAPAKPVRILSVSCFRLSDNSIYQLRLFESEEKKRVLTTALDALSDRWGEFAVVPGVMLNMKRRVLDRIAFGSVKELEEFAFRDESS